MRAIAVTAYGEPENFAAIETPDPTPGKGEVLLEVAASSVNPVDTKIRAGGREICPDLPAILHMDVSGIVREVGEGVAGFAPGDAVYGCAGGLKTAAGVNLQGALADYMAVDARLIAHAPKSLDLTDAAALPLVTITAWEALFHRAGIRADQSVLIHAGAGGVGHIAVQLARHAGARVYTTVSGPRKAAIARDLGAQVTIDYRRESLADYLREHTAGAGFDVVFDTVGGDTLAASMTAARVSGTVVTILANGEHDLTTMHARGLSLHAVFMLIPMIHGRGRAAHGEILQSAAALVDAGELRPLIDPERFSFAQAGAAHRKLASGAALGKIVLRH